MTLCTICQSQAHTALWCPEVFGLLKKEYPTRYFDSGKLDAWTGIAAMMSEPDGTPSRRGPDRAVVDDQLDDLTASLDDFVHRPELPAAKRDLTTYADAMASAVKNCPHENTTNLLYGREWQCDDCGKYLDRRAMKKSGGLGWMFG